MVPSILLLTLATSPFSAAYPWMIQRRAPSPVSTPSNSIAPRGPDPNDPRFSAFSPPGPGDVRSPCPGLNACANHNFINHDGKGLSVENLTPGLAACFNMGADFTAAIGGAGLLSNPFPLGGKFDLDNLDQHNFPIEHDASLSRQGK